VHACTCNDNRKKTAKANYEARCLSQTHGILVANLWLVLWLLKESIPIVMLLQKTFVPFDQVKYGGASYTRINTVNNFESLKVCSLLVKLKPEKLAYLKTSKSLIQLVWLIVREHNGCVV